MEDLKSQPSDDEAKSVRTPVLDSNPATVGQSNVTDSLDAGTSVLVTNPATVGQSNVTMTVSTDEDTLRNALRNGSVGEEQVEWFLQYRRSILKNDDHDKMKGLIEQLTWDSLDAVLPKYELARTTGDLSTLPNPYHAFTNLIRILVNADEVCRGTDLRAHEFHTDVKFRKRYPQLAGDVGSANSNPLYNFCGQMRRIVSNIYNRWNKKHHILLSEIQDLKKSRVSPVMSPVHGNSVDMLNQESSDSLKDPISNGESLARNNDSLAPNNSLLASCNEQQKGATGSINVHNLRDTRPVDYTGTRVHGTAYRNPKSGNHVKGSVKRKAQGENSHTTKKAKEGHQGLGTKPVNIQTKHILKPSNASGRGEGESKSAPREGKSKSAPREGESKSAPRDVYIFSPTQQSQGTADPGRSLFSPTQSPSAPTASAPVHVSPSPASVLQVNSLNEAEDSSSSLTAASLPPQLSSVGGKEKLNSPKEVAPASSGFTNIDILSGAGGGPNVTTPVKPFPSLVKAQQLEARSIANNNRGGRQVGRQALFDEAQHHVVREGAGKATFYKVIARAVFGNPGYDEIIRYLVCDEMALMVQEGVFPAIETRASEDYISSMRKSGTAVCIDTNGTLPREGLAVFRLWNINIEIVNDGGGDSMSCIKPEAVLGDTSTLRVLYRNDDKSFDSLPVIVPLRRRDVQYDLMNISALIGRKSAVEIDYAAIQGFTSLKREDQVSLVAAFELASKAKDVHVLFNARECFISLCARNFLRLRYGESVDDEVINIMAYSIAGDNPDIALVPSTMYASNIAKGETTRIIEKMKTENIDLFSKKKLILPCHTNNNHWVCGVVDFEKRTIFVLDSLLHKYPAFAALNLVVVKQLWTYLKTVHLAIKKTALDDKGWEMSKNPYEEYGVPKQRNNFDCGLFTLKFIAAVVGDKDLDFRQSEMACYRFQVALKLAARFDKTEE